MKIMQNYVFEVMWSQNTQNVMRSQNNQKVMRSQNTQNVMRSQNTQNVMRSQNNQKVMWSQNTQNFQSADTNTAWLYKFLNFSLSPYVEKCSTFDLAWLLSETWIAAQDHFSNRDHLDTFWITFVFELLGLQGW